MNKICTSIEQSKKLLELGVDINTADMRYGYIAPYDYSDRMYDGGYDEIPYPKDFLIKNPNFSANEYDGELPAWSLSALFNVLPKIVNNETLFVETSPSLWHIGYRNVYIARASKLVDACYEMICWLKKNNEI